MIWYHRAFFLAPTHTRPQNRPLTGDDVLSLLEDVVAQLEVEGVFHLVSYLEIMAKSRGLVLPLPRSRRTI